jgi:hypothetical protein
MSASDRPKPPNLGKPSDGLDPDAPPSDEELRVAEALRRVLEEERSPAQGGEEPSAREHDRSTVDAEARAAGELAASLRALASPREISAERHRRILDRALAAIPEVSHSSSLADGATGARRASGAREPEGSVAALGVAKKKVAYLAFGSAAALLAVAASVALVIRGVPPDRSMSAKASPERAQAVLALSRSTADLFPEGIAKKGGTTERVDRIASARAQDFRRNQFARWGAP